MPTLKQQLGDAGESLVARVAECPGCKTSSASFKVLPRNFKCADLVCDFCGYLAQVKTKRVGATLPQHCPAKILGAAWGPQRDRMEAGIYFSLYIVIADSANHAKIFFLPRDLQTSEMFVPRKPLSPNAKRAGWQGCMIEINKALSQPIQITKAGKTTFKLRT